MKDINKYKQPYKIIITFVIFRVVRLFHVCYFICVGNRVRCFNYEFNDRLGSGAYNAGAETAGRC